MAKEQRGRVKLEQVSRVLLLYSEALAGIKLRIASCKNEQGLVHPEAPDGDITTILLPLYVDRYGSAEENFAWYKVSATHQAGHIEFGTYNFSLEKVLNRLNKEQLPPNSNTGLSDIESFFNLFDDSKLAARIFKVVEDIRIDWLIKQEYAGIRDVYQRIQLESVSSRPPINSLTRRESFLEALPGIALDIIPEAFAVGFTSLLQSARQVIAGLKSPEATVYDSTEATITLYEKSSSFYNVPAAQEQELLNPTTMDDFAAAVADGISWAKGKTVGQRNSHNGEAALTEKPPVEAGAEGNPAAKPITQKDVERAVKQKIDPTEVLREHFASSGFHVQELVSHGMPAPKKFRDKRYETMNKAGIITLTDIDDDQVPSFLYDEWDFRTGSYLPRWCRVREIPLGPGKANYFKETLAKNSLLAKQINQQFERLTPQQLKKLNRIRDGDEFDLDAVIEAVQERKAGQRPSDNIYSKMVRPQRDVAVVFLIDMSASTSEVIKDARGKAELVIASGMAERPQRVIDVAKESVVLMISALEILHDTYGVYGFSSSGRDNVELHIIKGIDETFSPIIESRVDQIRPLFSTRMGPAIRHAASKLEVRHEKTKILFMVSDGYPQDRDYGMDSEDKEYAIRDTEMAFVEAKRQGIIPFCLTIDATGYDFLKEMSHHIEHQVIRNIRSLPSRLPSLYERLTS